MRVQQATVVIVLLCTVKLNAADPVPDELAEAPNFDPSVHVRNIISVTHDGVNYAMVKNLTLNFGQARQFCKKAFSQPMELLWIQQLEEWALASKHFSQHHTTSIWLGGQVSHFRDSMFLAQWFNRHAFPYHRFNSSEIQQWLNERPTDWPAPRCIAGVLESDGSGNWTVLHPSSCNNTKLPFICRLGESTAFETPEAQSEPGSGAASLPLARGDIIRLPPLTGERLKLYTHPSRRYLLGTGLAVPRMINARVAMLAPPRLETPSPDRHEVEPRPGHGKTPQTKGQAVAMRKQPHGEHSAKPTDEKKKSEGKLTASVRPPWKGVYVVKDRLLQG